MSDILPISVPIVGQRKLAIIQVTAQAACVCACGNVIVLPGFKLNVGCGKCGTVYALTSVRAEVVAGGQERAAIGYSTAAPSPAIADTKPS